MAHCLSAPSLQGRVMPLLRPGGRTEQDYTNNDSLFSENRGSLPGLPQNWYWQCCELWLQVAEEAEAAAWQEALVWLKAHRCAKGWRSHKQSLWQPFSPTHDECEYAETASAAQRHYREAAAKAFLQGLREDNRAWFLKALWFRATEVLSRELGAGNLVCGMDPGDAHDRSRIGALLAQMFADVSPGDYGIPCAPHDVDPSAFSVSHMTAFAVNALTRTGRGPHWIERHLGERATRPCCFSSRGDYLRLFGP